MVNNYRLGNREVEARRHTGTDESALNLAEWVIAAGGRVTVVPKGKYEYDLRDAFLRLHDRYDHFVRPNFWIIKTEDNQFYCVYPDIFRKYYIPLKVKETV